jgi:WD40 repeat protein/serine/threonine protein kinase
MLRITLLGSPDVTLDGQPVRGFVSAKSQALVYYLAATGQAHSRDALAGLLWSEVPDSTAKRNLRDVLSNLRHLIGSYLLITRQSVSLIQPASSIVDYEIFLEKLHKAQRSKEHGLKIDPEELESIREAIALYKGEFLTGFYVSGAPLFEDWILEERIHLQHELERGLDRLVSGYIARQEFKAAIEYAQLWTSLNPLHEPAYRYLMHLYTLDGNRSAAISQFQDCANILKKELGINPATETIALYKRILSGELKTGSPYQGELVIRGYELCELIGEGTYSAVYRAFQPLTKREVVIKVILPLYANDANFIRRFESDAQLVARLEHPHIVPLFDYWREPNRAYLVMRWLQGGSLQNSLEAGSWDKFATKKLIDQVTSALSVAHRQGLVHGAIKPANILLDEDGNAFLSDFGIAKDLSAGVHLEDHNVYTRTSAYLSPEQILGDEVSPLTDIYSLGVVLYETLTGECPFACDSLEELKNKQLSEPLSRVTELRPDLPIAVDEVIQKCTAKKPEDRFTNVLSVGEAFRLALSEETPSNLAIADIPLVEPFNPFKGLRPFHEDEAEDFFGRGSFIKILLDRLAESEAKNNFLAVVGPSGSGKSSIVRAGLIPALRKGALPGSKNWFVAQMFPGEHPFKELEIALLGIAVKAQDSLQEKLQADEHSLRSIVSECLPDESSRLLLFIDQFEEIFYQVERECERVHFLQCLYNAVTEPRSPLILVITLRADFYDRPLSYPHFGELLQTGMEAILPLSAGELVEAIVFPCERVGVRLEPGLETKIMSDVINQPGSLPSLQYTMTEMFDRREGNLLTFHAYEAVGGVMNALGRRAEEIYQGLDTVSQEAVRQLFLRLVRLDKATENTRRRILRSELEEIRWQAIETFRRTTGAFRLPSDPDSSGVMKEVIELFGRYRLLTFDHDPSTRAPTVEVAHEALLQKWERLQEWLDTGREDIRLHQNLNLSAHEWLSANRDPSYLLQGGRLDQIESWTRRTDLALTNLEDDYLQSSLDARQQRRSTEKARQDRERTMERRSRNFLRALVVVLTLATVMALVLTGIAFTQGQIAQKNAAIATVAQGQALNQAATAIVAKGVAQQQTRLATSRELGASALNNLSIDPERSILLALHALSTAHSLEAENALHRAIQASRVRLTLTGHTGPVHFVALSPDERKIATASQDGTAKIWDINTGIELLTLTGHSDEVIGIDFNSDGTRLATSSYDGTTKVWDANSGEEILTFTGHVGPVVSAYFNPDGTRLVTNGLYDGMVIVWDTNTGEALLSIRAHRAPIWHVTYDQEGTRIATASVDGTAKIWDAKSGELLLTLDGQAGLVSRVAFSPDGLFLATGHENGTAKIWDSGSGKELLSFEGHTTLVLWICFSPDGKRLATASVDGMVKIWDVTSGDELFTLAGHRSAVMGLVFTGDGNYLISGSFDGTTKVWDLTPTKELFTLDLHQDRVYSIDFNSDGTRFASGSFDGTAIIWDVTTGQEEIILGRRGDSDRIRAVAFSPDGMRLATSSADGTTTIWDTTSGQELLVLSGHAPGQTGETRFNGVIGVSFSPDGKLLATASDDLTAKIWDATSGEVIFTLRGHGHAPTSVPPFDGVIQVSFSPDGKQLATAGGDGTVKIWNVTLGVEVLTWEAHPGSVVIDLAFSPDGKRLITGSFDGTSKLWDSETGQALLTLSGHTSGVYGVAFTPDGEHLVTGSEDGTARIWDAETGQPLLMLTGNTHGILDIDISPDGRYLVTSSQDGSIRFYVLPIDELISLAQSRLTRSLTEAECQQFLHLECVPPNRLDH